MRALVEGIAEQPGNAQSSSYLLIRIEQAKDYDQCPLGSSCYI